MFRSIRNFSLGIGLLLALAGLLTLPAVGTAADDAARAQYVAQLEPICKKDTQRSSRILKGVKKRFNRGQFKPAARQFTRAAKAFDRTLKRVSSVSRPAEDAATLRTWIRAMKKQSSYMRQISRALRKKQEFKAYRLAVLLRRSADQANDIVFDFGFRHCILKPSRFM